MSEYQEKIENISNNLKSFIEKESDRSGKINRLEEKMQNFENYLSRSDEYYSEVKVPNQGMDSFIRKGVFDNLEVKSFSTDEGESGVVVTPSLNKKIISLMKAKSPMRSIASVETISTGSVDYIIEEGSFASGWVSEVEARNETNTSKLVRKRIPIHDLFAQPKATQRLLDDAEINIESWIAERLADGFAKNENAAFVNGDGNKKPTGLLKCDKVKSIDAGGEVASETLLALVNELPEEYLANATFLMNRTTLARIQFLKDKMDRFIWQQSLTDPLKQTLFGVPVVCVAEMPNIAKGALSIAVGDFNSAYKIIDRSSINIMRDPYTEKPFVKFYATKRVGGDVINPDAVRFAKFA